MIAIAGCGEESHFKTAACPPFLLYWLVYDSWLQDASTPCLEVLSLSTHAVIVRDIDTRP